MLCQLVGCHCKTTYKLQTHLITLYLLPNEMKPDSNVLTTLVIYWIFSQLDGRLILDKHKCFPLLLFHPHLRLQLGQVESLLHGIAHCHVLC